MRTGKHRTLRIINQYASTPKYSSGAGERFYYLAPHFNREGYKVEVISGSNNHLFIKAPYAPKLINVESIEGGLFKWIRLRKYRASSFLGRLYSWFEFLFKLFFLPGGESRPDIIIVSSMSIFPIFYASYIKRKSDCKVILEVRDIWPLTPIELGGYSRRHPFILFMSWVEKFAYKKVDKIVSVLPGLKLHVENVLGHAKDVTWIPNGIQQSSEVGAERTEIQMQKSIFNVVYTGGLGIANAMSYVVDAGKLLKEYEDINLVIIGEGPEKDGLRDSAANFPGIKFYSKVPKEEVASLLEQADACIISWRDRHLYKFGVSANKYNDYMLAAKPIVSASNIEDDPVLLANCGIRVLPENPQAIADGILQLYHISDTERNKIGANGKAFVLENNTYDKIAHKYIRVLESL